MATALSAGGAASACDCGGPLTCTLSCPHPVHAGGDTGGKRVLGSGFGGEFAEEARAYRLVRPR